MPDVVFWPLFITFFAVAVGAALKAVEALHAKKLSDDEVTSLRAKLDVLNKPKGEKALDVQKLDAREPKESTQSLPHFKSDPHDEHLEEVREKILLLLAKRAGSTITEISKSLNIEVQLATFHLNELLAIKFVHHPGFYASSPKWSIAQEGRRYLVNHGLL